MGYKVAVVGATGNVGREMLDILAERSFPPTKWWRWPRARAWAGVLVRRQDAEGEGARPLRLLRRRHLPDVGRRRVSKEWSPKIAAAGAVVIDNSIGLAHGPGVPLVVPEVNADAVAGFARRTSSPIRIARPPSCVVALKPLHDKATDQAGGGGTYQSVSGAGKGAMDELFSQTKAVFRWARS